ncbi:MAG: lactate racemase domain-containing protein, partial [Planctomycetota bacterium]
METPLHYGKGAVTLEIPQDNIAASFQPRQFGSTAGHTDILSKAIAQNQVGFTQQIKDRTVGVLLPDGTRDLPVSTILLHLLPLLQDAGKVLFFICTGTHNADTPENQKIIDCIQAQTISFGIHDVQIIAYDCRKAAFTTAGVTRHGTEVQYNVRLDEPDVFVVLSDVKHHYFAGYSNPVKNIMPGLCAFKTIEQNHSLTFDDRSRAGIHPWHPDKNKRDNPLAADQLEAMSMIVNDRLVWALTTITNAGQILWSAFDNAQTAAAGAFEQVDQWNIHAVKPVDLMIVSPGGLPNDVDLYIAQRALELTASVVRDGGQILFLAACPGGIGSPLTTEHFEKRLLQPPEEILSQDRDE